MILIKLILFVFLFTLIFGIAVIVAFFKKFNSSVRQFQDQMSGRARTSAGRPEGEYASRSQTTQRQEKKIIPKDEGEYVDFEEVR